MGWSTGMTNCCEDKGCELAALRERHSRVLWIVLALNSAMFLIEGTAGLLAHSTSLLADSLDMLGDALAYGLALFVVARSARWQAGAALFKGAFMLVFGLAVLGEAVHKALYPTLPAAQTMGLIAALALAANLACFLLLYRHRGDNLNMSSTWVCSRNDLVANTAVLVAAAATALLASRWPDILVGCLIAGLFVGSALGILRESAKALRAPTPARPEGPRPVPVALDRGTRGTGPMAPPARALEAPRTDPYRRSPFR